MPDHAPRRVRPARDKKARGTRKSRRRQTERRHAQDRSSLFQFDKRADKILGMQEDHGLAMRADARLARSGNRGALRPQLVPSSVNVFDFIADVVHAAIRILLEEIRDRRIVAQRLEQFDLRVAEIDEYRRHTVIGLRHFLRDRKSTRLNSSHGYNSYAVFCLKKKNKPPLAETRLSHRDRNHPTCAVPLLP